MLLPVNITVLKYSTIALAFIAAIGFGYRTAYNHGHLSGRNSCIKETEELIQQIHQRISGVEKTIDKLSDLALNQQEKLSRDIEEILKKVKSKPVVIIKNGKCVPSPQFVEGLNEAIRRANQK